MKHNHPLILAAAVVCSALTLRASAQQTKILPSLSIAGSSLESSASYDAGRHVYMYRYTIHAASTNKVPIDCFGIDVAGRIARPQVDPDLRENIDRSRALQAQPATMIPIGVTVPDPGHTSVIFGRTAGLVLCSRDAWDVQPGGSAAGFVIESKFPPGPRDAHIEPSRVSREEVVQNSTMDDTFQSEDGATSYTVTTSVIGPFDPDETKLFDGGGQSADVNNFLRYARPTETRTSLPAGTASYTIVIFYGQSIMPSTFRATLNNQNISSLFQPIPGATQAVTIKVGPGTTKLHISVDGLKASGGKGADSDTLTFVFP